MNIRVGMHGPDNLRRITARICAHLRLNCTLIPYEGYTYGDADEFGHGDGMVGEVQRNHYDTFQPCFTPTFSRFRAIDFSDPYFYSDIVLATRRADSIDEEEEGSFINLSLVMAFRWETWLAFILSLIFTSIFLSTSTRWVFDGRTSRSNGWLLALVDPLPALIQHKWADRYLKYDFVRVLIAFWSICMVVLSCAYTGLLFSAKIKSSASLPYKDLETFVDCLIKDKCAIISETTSATQIWALYRYEGVRGALERRSIILAQLDRIPPTILAEKNRHLVWIADRFFFDAYTRNNTDCKFYTIVGFNEAWTFPLRKNSSTELRTILNRGAAAFQESGLYRGEFLEHREEDKACLEQQVSSLIRGSTRTPFYFLALGLGFALGGLVIEMSFGRWRRNRVIGMG